MSKPQQGRHKFPPLQKLIILHLAHSKPQTINQTKKGIRKDYKSTYIALSSLKQKGLVQQTTTKTYRGREYPEFWLAEKGIFLALYYEPKPASLLWRTIEIYPENKGLHFLIEAVPILGRNALDVLYLAASTDGEIQQDEIDSILARQMAQKLTPEQIKQFAAILKKYPEQQQQCVSSLKQASENISKISKLVS
jgi:hypothetical protein